MKSHPTKSEMHSRAARYYTNKFENVEIVQNIMDLEDLLLAYEHFIKCNRHDDACKILNQIDYRYLQRWGYSARVINLRRLLIGHLRSTRLQAFNFESLGKASFRLGILNDAIEYYEKALQISGDLDNKKQRKRDSALLDSLGIAYLMKGNIVKSIELHSQALEISNSLNDTYSIGIRKTNLAVAHITNLDLKQARQLLDEALEIAERVNDKIGRSVRQRGIANILMKLGKTDQAMKLHTSALEISIQTNHMRSQAITLGSIGDCYMALDRLELAHEYYEKSYLIAQETLDQAGEIAEQKNIARVFLVQSEYTKANQLLNDILENAIRIGDKRSIAQTSFLLGLSELYLDQPAKALQLLEKFGETIPEVNVEIQSTLSIAYYQMGQLDKAREYNDATIRKCTEILKREPNYVVFDLINILAQYIDALLNSKNRIELHKWFKAEIEERENNIHILGLVKDVKKRVNILETKSQ